MHKHRYIESQCPINRNHRAIAKPSQFISLKSDKTHSCACFIFFIYDDENDILSLPPSPIHRPSINKGADSANYTNIFLVGLIWINRSTLFLGMTKWKRVSYEPSADVCMTIRIALQTKFKFTRYVRRK